jgi:hypothetical protein
MVKEGNPLFYVLQTKTFQLIKQEDGSFKEDFLWENIDRKVKSKSQVIEELKEVISNDLFLSENGGAFNKLSLFSNAKDGCVTETKYFVASMVSRRIDRVYVKTTWTKDPITRNNSDNCLSITNKDYKSIYKELKNFVKNIKVGEHFCIM